MSGISNYEPYAPNSVGLTQVLIDLKDTMAGRTVYSVAGFVAEGFEDVTQGDALFSRTSDGKVGRRYGARTTPHIFIVDKGKLVYMGAHDNQKPAGRKKQPEYRNYVEEALDAVLAGKEVPLSVTEPYGCSVKYKKKEK